MLAQAQSAADPHSLDPLHIQALDDPPLPQDGEAQGGLPVLARGVCGDKTWERQRVGVQMKRKKKELEKPWAQPLAYPVLAPSRLSSGSLVLWRGFSKTSHMGRLRNAKIHVERAIKVGGDLEWELRKDPGKVLPVPTDYFLTSLKNKKPSTPH
jgi:hypothetical protein